MGLLSFAPCTSVGMICQRDVIICETKAASWFHSFHSLRRGGCSEDEAEKERKAAAEAKLSERERIRTSREALPSYAYRQQFLEAVYKHQVLIIVAETGAGKTTQLPQYLLEEGFGKAGAPRDSGE